MWQVNRFLFKPNLARSYSFFSDTHLDPLKPMKVLYPLKSRSLIKITGNETSQFLQGLITNDMYHFEDGALSMYAMFLNTKGRVLYDALVHKWGEHSNTFMLECDKAVHSLLLKHLNVYKLRRDVQIGDVSQYFNVWALILPADTTHIDYECDIMGDINVFKDPRLQDLGYRIITSTSVDTNDLLKTFGKDTDIESNERGYKSLKYRLGVGEGPEDLFPGTCLPLEVNCDYLHGVSFHKGCYIGQELTARIHHTGVVRKRLMPLKFLVANRMEEMDKDDPIWNEKFNQGKIIGKMKTYSDGYGLGLVKIKEALEATVLNVRSNAVKIIKPTWWPIEAPKEKIPSSKPTLFTIKQED